VLARANWLMALRRRGHRRRPPRASSRAAARARCRRDARGGGRSRLDRRARAVGRRRRRPSRTSLRFTTSRWTRVTIAGADGHIISMIARPFPRARRARARRGKAVGRVARWKADELSLELRGNRARSLRSAIPSASTPRSSRPADARAAGGSSRSTG
jgi:hypothetical protein